MQRRRIEVSAFLLVACCLLPSNVLADTDTVRLGEDSGYSQDNPYSNLGTIAALQAQLATDMQHFVTGFHGCADIVVRDLNEGTEQDQLRDTWTIIQSFRVECWAALNFDPDFAVTPTRPDDRITPEMIHKTMAKARQLSAADEEWAKGLMTFFGGTITCKDKERCRLQSPDGGDWANYSLDFDLLLVHGDDWFIEVTDAYRGREDLVYGVWWREMPEVTSCRSIR